MYSEPMKNMENMPATETTWMRFAPVTLRERKMRSGMSGLLAVASRATNAASSASEIPTSTSVRGAPQPSSAAGSTMV